MHKTLADYQTRIAALPDKPSYTRDDLLIPDFLLEKSGTLEIYYAPHNEYANSQARIFIVGITPGFQQMSQAFVTAHRGLVAAKPLATIQYECKVAARFSGSMRTNIINMLDSLHLNQALGLASCAALFDEQDHWLHTVSLIPYPVFVKGTNYTGHTPKLGKTPLLMNYARHTFAHEFGQLQHKEHVLLIPLGKAVEEVLQQLASEGCVDASQILSGFPHPSGANVNRLKELEKHRPALETQIRQFAAAIAPLRTCSHQ
ncbi:hypothetical protein P0W48_15145 [Plesiomonas shigelloides]|uniref:hypothetical protein n=1 Tax=Plesiomonas shigelloides TaxID=703 RepID=UPI0024324006|nr:hypothetical protein [Plesiomonas shigelloides]